MRPVTDNGANRKRLERVRVVLGWDELGREPSPDFEEDAASSGINSFGAFQLWDRRSSMALD